VRVNVKRRENTRVKEHSGSAGVRLWHGRRNDGLDAFREDHKDQLGRFRTKMAELTKSIDRELTIEALQQRVADIYTNEVKPTISEMKDCLSASNIKWVLESFLKNSMLSVPATSALPAFGLSIPHALLAGFAPGDAKQAVNTGLERFGWPDLIARRRAGTLPW
jgi:hypothetical protein